MEYRFTDGEGKLFKFSPNAEGVEQLYCDRWMHGRDSTRWTEIYRTPVGRYVQIKVSLWQGESNHVHFIDEHDAAYTLSGALEEHISEAGMLFLQGHDLAEEA